MKLIATVCSALGVLVLVGCGSQPLSSTSPDIGAPAVRIEFEQTQLANGLRVILVPDRSAPLVSSVLVYDVGSANEVAGLTGFAHMFEHMLFQGSENIAAGQHTSLIQRRGGQSDATTANDYTLYYDSLPSNQLELALFLEADRLRSLAITPANFDRERQVVKEERRMRIDNQPYGHSNEVLNSLLYDNFAYHHPGMGLMADLDAASVRDLRAFFDTYYTAANAVLVIAGDFERERTLALIEKYFGGLPQRAKPAAVDYSEPPQTQARRQIVADPLAPAVRLAVAFKAVAVDQPDFYALRVLSAVLQEGHSSRLHAALVDRELATQISGEMEELRGPGALYINATLPSAVPVAAAEQALWREIARLQQEPVADWELDKARNAIAVNFFGGLQRTLLRGWALGRAAVDFNDPSRINNYVSRINAVTAQDVQRVAKTYLRETNRTIVVTVPAKTGEAS